MSSLKKLSIRGIRSFGTEREDEQKITFESPLTLIVGENGSGKTTVIECLKYALTGEMPPGSERGKLFIHDPKIFRRTTTSGQIKLQVTDTLGQSKTCIRSMQTEEKKGGKSTFKALDSTIITEDAKGKKEESGRRVEEVNLEMAASMGVSKAILNNVIFCHQEDSNWPLDEGKKLKEKFDAIFGTTEYNKAIEKLIKIRKKSEIELKLIEQEKRYKLEAKSEADKKQLELQKLTGRQDRMLAEIKALEASLKPITMQLEKILVKEQTFGKLHAKKAINEATIERCESSIKKKRDDIKKLLECDIEELEKQIEAFDETQKKNQTELSNLKEKRNEIAAEQKKLETNVVQDKGQLSKWSDKMGELQDLQSKRGEEIKLLADKLEVSLMTNDFSQGMTADDAATSVYRIKQSIEEQEETLKDMKLVEEAKEVELQEQIDKIRDEKTSFETNLKTQNQRILTLNDEKKKTERDIQAIESATSDFTKLTNKIEAAKKKLENFKAQNNIEDLQEQREFIETDKTELELKIDALEKDIEILESISKITNELETKKRELLQNQSDFERTKNKHSSTLKDLFPSKAVNRNFKNVVQARSDELKREVNEMMAEEAASRIKKTRLQTERDHHRKEFKRKQKELNEISEKIEKLCDGRDYLDVLTTQKDKVDKLTMDLAYHRSSESMLNHYKQDIEQDPCCPLCHKNLNANEGDELKEDIEEKIRQLPNRIADTEKKRNIETRKFDELNKYRSSFENIEKLKNEIKVLQEEIKRLDVEYQQNNERIEDLEIQIAEPKSKQELMTAVFISDMSRLDDWAKLIESVTRDVNSLEAQLPKEMPQKSLVDAKVELKKLSLEVKTMNDNMNQLSKTINEYQSKANSLQVEVNKLVSEKVQHQEKLQGLDQMKNNVKKIEVEISELKYKNKLGEQKLPGLTEKLDILIKQKEKSKNKAKEETEKLQKEIQELNLRLNEIVRLNAEIESYEKMDLEKKISEVMANIKQSTSRVEKLENKIKDKTEEIQRLTDEVSNQEGTLRNLKDNMELHKLEMEKNEAQQNLDKMRKEMGEMNPRKLAQEKERLNKERDKISEDIQTKTGEKIGLKDRIASAEEELNERKYKNAHKNYMLELYKEHVKKAQIDDIKKYCNALERSLLKFHATKMNEINQTIRGLWNSIYKGNDIDYIMIKTDEDEAKTTSDKRRSYSYRVVQVKNAGSEIDMRGRCSAGQKVLASLIIRMALAETFSANCKILALDEPTTNLDQNNINALTEALAQIIEEREKTGNFMLIVITHDENFVTQLERAEHYFKLSRDNHGRSRIEKIQNY